MTSAKQESAAYSVSNILSEWDTTTKERRRVLLQDFIDQHQNKSGPELELEMAQMSSLFLARISVWLKLTYMTGCCLTEQLKALFIFTNASGSHHYISEFLEHGGVLCLLEILLMDKSKEDDKMWAIKVLNAISNAGVKYKEIICESYGVRAIGQCMAKSKSEDTQKCARDLLESLADANPRFLNQVYKGLIGIMPCSSPKAQKLAMQSIRVVQPIVGVANRALIDQVLQILKTLHLEVHSAAIELVRDLMSYDIRTDILQGIVSLLKPHRQIQLSKYHNEGDDEEELEETPPPLEFVQQAAAAKLTKILSVDDRVNCEKLIQMNVIHNLLYAMGNVEYPNSQIQSCISLQWFCDNYPFIRKEVRKAMGKRFFKSFLSDARSFYTTMTPVQCDVLLSNKVNVTMDNANDDLSDSSNSSKESCANVNTVDAEKKHSMEN